MSILSKVSFRYSVKHQQWAFNEFAQAFYRVGSLHPEIGCMVIHGFGGTPANVYPIADRLSNAGYTVYAPLLSGHGTTLGDMNRCTAKTWRQDVFDAYQKLVSNGCQKIVVMGLSMGGVLAALLAEDMPCSGLVMMCPSFRMQPYLYRAACLAPFLPYASFPESRHPCPPYDQMYQGTAVRKLWSLERLARMAISELPTIQCPTLLMHARHDNKVSPDSLQIVSSALSKQQLEVICLENSYHGCSYGPERDLVANHCLHFVNQHILQTRRNS